MQRGGSKSNFFVVPSGNSAPYGMRSNEDLADGSPRRITTVQTLRGPNVRGSPHPYRANRDGQRSRCHTPDDLLNSDGPPMGVGGFARPQSIHDVQHSSNAG